MNDNLKNFMNNMGILCETWIVTYNNFIQRGMDHKTALEHTKAFVSAFFGPFNKNNGGDEE